MRDRPCSRSSAASRSDISRTSGRSRTIWWRRLEGATLTLATGEARAGADLRALIEEARTLRRLLDNLHSRYNRSLVEQAALAGALKPLADPVDPEAEPRARLIAERMNAIAEETERSWTARVEAGGYARPARFAASGRPRSSTRACSRQPTRAISTSMRAR